MDGFVTLTESQGVASLMITISCSFFLLLKLKMKYRIQPLLRFGCYTTSFSHFFLIEGLLLELIKKKRQSNYTKGI